MKNPTTFNRIYLVLPLLVLGVLQAPAQTIIWGTPKDMSDPSDVKIANSTYVDAAAFYVDSLSINGVSFNTLTGTGSTELSNNDFVDSTGDISVTLGSGGGAQSGTSFTSGGSTPDSTNYDDLASRFGYDTSANSVKLNGLTALQTYQVEVWSSASNFVGLDSTTFTGATPVTLTPEDNQYAIGTFVASSSSETFTFEPNGEDYGFINAVSVRAIPALSVPEPGTWALMMGGVALLAVMRWKRRLAL